MGELTASLAEGVFRFVTGKTSQGQDKAMTLEVPFGTIGIRGTIGAVKTDGDRSLIVLLGPGSQNNADERSGAIDVTAQGKTVSLIRPRFGTIIEAGKPPLEPFELSDLELALILDPLAPPPSQPPALAPSITNAVHAAQQDVAAARETSGTIGGISERLDELTDPYDPVTFLGFGSDFPTFADLPTTGVFAFNEASPPLTGGGTYSFFLTVDWGNRTLGGGVESDFIAANNSPVAGPGLQEFFGINPQSFDDAAGAAAGIPAFKFPGVFPSGATLDFQLLIINGGDAAQNSILIKNSNTGQTATGSTITPLGPAPEED